MYIEVRYVLRIKQEEGKERNMKERETENSKKKKLKKNMKILANGIREHKRRGKDVCNFTYTKC